MRESDPRKAMGAVAAAPATHKGSRKCRGRQEPESDRHTLHPPLEMRRSAHP